MLACCAASAPAAPPADPLGEWLLQQGLAPAARLESQAADGAHAWRTELVLTALNFLDLPYRRGGNSADDGFDCSGFTRHVYGHSLGLQLPRSAAEQSRDASLHNVPQDSLLPGDLVFFNTLQRVFSHVGIYIGDGRFVHAPRSGARVRVEDMRTAYWARRFNGARRVDPLGTQAPLPR